MIDLSYPINGKMRPLPDDEFALKTGEEMFPVISEQGEVTAAASRKYCHSGSKVLHPVVHLHLIDRSERIYLQKRSSKKDLMPGKWDTSVGGHVMYGESIAEALIRESSEELSIDGFNPIFLGSYRWDTARDAEMVYVFAAVGDCEPVPDEDEVDDGRWWPVKELETQLDSGIFTPNFVSEFRKIRQRLFALL